MLMLPTFRLLTLVTVKNLIGKPRPDMLARCIPDLTNISQHAVGGFGDALGDFGNAGWMLVDQKICTQTNQSHLKDGFRSFPSGHSSSKQSFLPMRESPLIFCSVFRRHAIPFVVSLLQICNLMAYLPTFRPLPATKPRRALRRVPQ